MTALAKLSSLEQAYSQARENFEQIVGYLDSKEASGMTHSELERELEKKGRELMRKRFRDDILTLTLPIPLFQRMEKEADDCVFQIPSWKRLVGR